MPSADLRGEIPEGCVLICIVLFVIGLGLYIANEGAVNNNPLQMSLGIIIALGTLTLALGGRAKLRF
ncbi:MAG: hypothetical protein ACE5IO_06135 [Thermoplasmata archaeon]